MSTSKRQIKQDIGSVFILQKKDVVIIGVTGYSGSGKTTATQALVELLPDAYCIHGDNYLFEYLTQFPKETERIFGVPVDTTDGAYYLKCFEKNLTFELWEELAYVVSPYLNTRITKTIDSLVSSKNPRFILVDYAALPSLNIWDKSHYKVLVQTNDCELRFGMLYKLNGLGILDKKTVENRQQIIGKYIENISTAINYTLNNNYDDNFYDEIKTLSCLIKNRYPL